MVRKRKRQRLVFVFILVILLCGCNSKNEVNEEVNYSFFTGTKNSGDVQDDNQEDVLGDSQKDEDNDLSVSREHEDKINKLNEAALSELTNLSESMDFNGTEGEFIIAPAGNSFENSKGFSKFSDLVCHDEKNECIYYINYGKDDYIYESKDNNTTLLIEEKARCVQLWEDKIYFVNATGIFMTGDAYCYDLETKQLTKVIEGEIGDLYIDEDGIIFSEYEINEEEKSSTYHMMKLNHNSKTPLACDTNNIYKYEDFVLQFNQTTEWIELVNRETSDVRPVFSYEYLTDYRVYGSYVIIKRADIFLVINLSTGKKMIYDITQCNLPSDSFQVKDYIVIDHTLYVAPSISDYMVTVDIDSGAMNCIQNTEQTSDSMDALYVAGDKIYAYLNMYVQGETTFTELIISYDHYHYE